MKKGDTKKVLIDEAQINVIPVELTSAQLEARQQDTLFLLEGPEELIRKSKERDEKRQREVIELQSGQTRTLESYLTAAPLPYFPKFPNDVPFYSELYRVADLNDEWNPDEFHKPAIIAVLTNELIYSRFGKTMITELRRRTIIQGIRVKKFFQYFDVEGQKKVIEFRDQSIDMLKDFKAGQLYEFRLAYSTKYGTSFQLKIKD
jgi:hypothetical protein